MEWTNSNQGTELSKTLPTRLYPLPNAANILPVLFIRFLSNIDLRLKFCLKTLKKALLTVGHLAFAAQLPLSGLNRE